MIYLIVWLALSLAACLVVLFYALVALALCLTFLAFIILPAIGAALDAFDLAREEVIVHAPVVPLDPALRHLVRIEPILNDW